MARVPVEELKPSQRVAIGISHALRCNILSILSVRTASPIEMALDLGVPVSDLSYHVRVLRDAGFIEVVGERPVRGSTEHFYRATETNYVNGEEWAQLTPQERIEYVEGTIRFAFADAGAALDSGSMGLHTDNCVARVPLSVDEPGWQRLVEIFDRAFEEVQAVKGESANRMAEDPSIKAIPAATQLLFFELPRPSRNVLPDPVPPD